MSKWINNSTIKEELGIDELSTEMLYTALDYLEECDFNRVEQSIFETWKLLDTKDTESFVLDVTDTYINGKHDSTCTRRGKDGKVSKLKQIGLAVSFDNGFPIMHKTYNGTMHNVKILDDLMAIMAERGVNTIVLDRGFFSEETINDMHKLKMKMIVGIKQTIGIKKSILSRINRESIYTKTNQVSLKNTFIYVQEQKYLFGKLIVIYNPKYEALKRDKMLSEESTDRDVRFVGYSMIFHNTNLDPKDVVKKYFDKDIIERSFRTMKTEIKLHPIRHWMPSRINAHIKVCYLCMCLLALIQFKCRSLKLSAIDAISELEAIYKINMKHSITKHSFTKVVVQSKIQKDIIKKLKCSV
jgi:transposase